MICCLANPTPQRVREDYENKQGESLGTVDFEFMKKYLADDTKVYSLGKKMTQDIAKVEPRE